MYSRVRFLPPKLRDIPQQRPQPTPNLPSLRTLVRGSTYSLLPRRRPIQGLLVMSLYGRTTPAGVPLMLRAPRTSTDVNKGSLHGSNSPVVSGLAYRHPGAVDTMFRVGFLDDVTSVASCLPYLWDRLDLTAAVPPGTNGK